MNEATKSAGKTASERYLARISERSFLNLWSYPNVHVNKNPSGRKNFRELCDLLVVCGDHILIFSDKENTWPDGRDLETQWKRWYRRAVAKSIRQVRGAERWISLFPDQLFLDEECTRPLPIRLPPENRRKVYCIVVANGAMEACQHYFDGGIGSMMNLPRLRDSDHIDSDTAGFRPFAIGDVDTTGSFVHVLTEVTLDIVMSELDTITDFTRYLDKKAEFVRSGRLISAHGEEDLVSYYMTHVNSDGEHDFAHPEGRDWSENDSIVIASAFDEMVTDDRYVAKKRADEISYVWDQLIEIFTTPMIEGTTIVPEGKNFKLSDTEVAVRYMALEDRFRRRMLGKAVMGAFEEGRKSPRFARAMVGDTSAQGRDIGFFLMTLECPKDLHFQNSQDGYDRYRAVRRSMLEVYAYGYMKRFPSLKRIIGIGVEPPPKSEGLKGGSEDMVMLEEPKWTAELEESVMAGCKHFNILQGPGREYRPEDHEWPNEGQGEIGKNNPRPNSAG